MHSTKIQINSIPAIIWGTESDKVCLCVHGKMSCKESAEGLAQIAVQKGYQTLSFDLPQHGERKHEARRCDIWNGMEDLKQIGDYVFQRWNNVSLYACSLGAYFSLHAYPERCFQNCLFQSPILDMEYLIRQMFLWFDVSEERLYREREIDTPIDTLRWDYFQFVLSHPISEWKHPTHILYGAKDDLQSPQIIHDFTQRFGCQLTISENSKHPFMEEQDFPIIEQWLEKYL